MSYDIRLKHPVTGETLEVEHPHHLRGGTYAIGGTTEAWLNITWNYGRHYYRVFPARPARDDEPDGTAGGVRTIYGMTGAESIPVLEQAISKLGDDVHDDYWQPTEGNAKAALHGLLALARMRPDGVWDGD